MSREQESKAVFLSADLHARIEERARETGFGSVEEYVTFVMEEVLKDEGEGEQAFSKEEEEEVKKRLKALGYLD
ncbi:MAG: CopG family transcriptional regulator [Chloroflexi bacterium]|nr:MAG: CopG family transcriptional regulator [Chloroflexota bacterium]RLC97046.1 MAG: CopG family transcriptional regulator [Chloroflexota bacterium]